MLSDQRERGSGLILLWSPRRPLAGRLRLPVPNTFPRPGADQLAGAVGGVIRLARHLAGPASKARARAVDRGLRRRGSQ
jgi:hypothetical protein